MSNVLTEEKKNQVIALGRLGWSLRRIERETGVRRETAASYLKGAGIGVRFPGAWGRRPPAPDPKPANARLAAGPTTGPESDVEPAKEAIANAGSDSKPANEVIPDFDADLRSLPKPPVPVHLTES